jgi:hypothetical protein
VYELTDFPALSSTPNVKVYPKIFIAVVFLGVVEGGGVDAPQVVPVL